MGCTWMALVTACDVTWHRVGQGRSSSVQKYAAFSAARLSWHAAYYPELDIQPTEKCEAWTREVYHIAQAKLARSEVLQTDPGSPMSPANLATLSQVSNELFEMILGPVYTLMMGNVQVF